MNDDLQNVGSSSRTYRKPQTKSVPLISVAREYLNGVRKLNDDTLKAFRLCSTPDGKTSIPFFDERGDLQLVKFRHATGGMLSLGDREVKTYIEPGGRPVLFGSNLALASEGPLVACFGEYDAMSVYQAGIVNAVSLPFGDKGHDWISEQWDFLETFSEIILFTDKDEYPNKKAKLRAEADLELLVKRLGKHRVRMVADKYREGTKDANELLVKHGEAAIVKAIENAIEFPETDLVRVAEFVDEELQQGRLTGFAFIDRETGGFRDGDLIVVSGDNGAGKTTTTLKIIAAHTEQRIPALIWSGEQNPGKLRYWYERIVAGREYLRKVQGRTDFKYYFPEEAVQPFIREWYADYFFQYTNRNVDAAKLFEVAELAVRRYGVKLFVIDNLMAFTGGESDHYLHAQADFVQSCKAFAEAWRTTVVLICHNRKPPIQKISSISLPTKDDIEGARRISNWADTVLQLYRVPKALQVDEWEEANGAMILCKNREGGTEGTIKTVVDAVSNRVVELSESGHGQVEYSWVEAYKESAR